jgi:hypothetical protein
MSRPLRQFLFRMALNLGKTVGEIESTMSSAELTEWLAYAGIDPLPDAHWDAAQIASTVARSMTGKGKHEDYLPKTERQRRKREPKLKLSASESRGLLSRLCGQSGLTNPPRSAGGAGRSDGR